jgi:predicted PurR-regulated permease PerM
LEAAVKAGLAETALGQWFLWLAITGMVLLFLIYGRPFLVPIATAFLVFTVISAAIDKIAQIRLGTVTPPYWISVAVGILLLGIAMFVLYSIVTVEIVLLIEQWPALLDHARKMLASLSEWLGADVAGALQTAFGDFNILTGLRNLVTPAGIAITTILVVILYVAFLFVESRHFPAKVELMFAKPECAAQFKETAGRIVAGVHRYLLLKTLLCVANALAAYAVMKLVGLEYAEAWAVLTFFLFFIPKLGAVIAFILPPLFAVLQFEAWQPVLFLVVGLAVVQFVMGEVVEPRLMGSSLNLSPLVILLALAFWTLIWGLAGAFLAIPMTVVILTVCSKVPALRPVAILLSKEGDPDSGGPNNAASAQD